MSIMSQIDAAARAAGEAQATPVSVRTEDGELHDSYLHEVQQYLAAQPLPAHLVSYQAYKAALHSSDAIQYPSVLPCQQCHKPTDYNISPLCDECDPFRAHGSTIITLLSPHWLSLQASIWRACAWLLEPRYTQAEWTRREEAYAASYFAEDANDDDEIPF